MIGHLARGNEKRGCRKPRLGQRGSNCNGRCSRGSALQRLLQPRLCLAPSELPHSPFTPGHLLPHSPAGARPRALGDPRTPLWCTCIGSNGNKYFTYLVMFEIQIQSNFLITHKSNARSACELAVEVAYACVSKASSIYIQTFAYFEL